MALFATHPIQYQVPWYRGMLHEGLDLHVFYSLIPDAEQQAVGFGGKFSWDVPLLDGYPWTLLQQRVPRPSLGRFFGSWSAGIGRALVDLRPDIVLLTGWNQLPLLQALAAAVQLGLPRIVRGESNALRPRRQWTIPLHRALLAAYDGFLSIGHANREFYERAGVPPYRIVEGGYFVDNDHIVALADRELPRRTAIREGWGIPDGAVCFLFSGKLVAKKRPLDFVEALRRVANQLPGGAVHGLVAGAGEMEGEVRSVVESLKVPLTLAGFLNQSEIGRAYAAADVLVLPSDWGETWGLVVNEAMLFGRPAIVSDRVGCGPDLVEDGETGFVFPFGEVDALVACMRECFEDGELRRRLGERAKTRVAGYSPSRGAAAARELVDRLVP